MSVKRRFLFTIAAIVACILIIFIYFIMNHDSGDEDMLSSYVDGRVMRPDLSDVKQKKQGRGERSDSATEQTGGVDASTTTGIKNSDEGDIDEDVDRIKDVVIDTINSNPQVIIDSIKTHHKKQIEGKQEELSGFIRSKSSEIQNNPNDPSTGDKNAPIVVVGFFDYSCGYCKKMAEVQSAISKAYPNVRFVFKELPILGERSVYASRAALAVNMIDSSKYVEFHDRLMSLPSLTPSGIKGIAEDMNIDPKQLRDKMNDPQIDRTLQDNSDLANSLSIRGTPSYIINDQLFQSFLDYKAFSSILDGIQPQSSVNTSGSSGANSNAAAVADSNEDDQEGVSDNNDDEEDEEDDEDEAEDSDDDGVTDEDEGGVDEAYNDGSDNNGESDEEGDDDGNDDDDDDDSDDNDSDSDSDSDDTTAQNQQQ